MLMTLRTLEPTGHKTGVLLPDFTVETMTGRTIHRREFKGRKHLVICFAPAGSGLDGQRFIAAVAANALGWQAERAETLMIVPDPVAPASAAIDPLSQALAIVVDVDGHLRTRFGVGAEAAVFIADRYGEIVFYAAGTTIIAGHGSRLDEILPLLELLEMRCSL